MKGMKKKWLREVARDLIAFGSIPFLVLTTVRVSVLAPYYPMQFIVSSALFFILKALFRGSLHAGLGFILLVFTSLYYGSLLFAVFAALVYAGLTAALFYLNTGTSNVLKGIMFGVLSAAGGYLIVRMIFF